MKTLPLAEAKAKLGRLVSPDEYEGWKETQAIRSDPELMAEIRRGLRRLERRGRIYTLEELRPEA
jgi:hypothetical protein